MAFVMHGMRTADIFDTDRGNWPPAWWATDVIIQLCQDLGSS